MIAKLATMKKIIYLAIVLFLVGGSIYAQEFKIEKSAEFDEPEYGWNKLLQLKNGNTFFFHSTRKDGIEVTVYNKQRKQIASRTLESNLWDVSKMKQARIVGLYEINGEPVIFIVQADDREPTLYRMRINPTTGSKLNEMKLGNLPKIKAFAGYAMAFGNVDMPDIIVEKDPNSDCYAVIYFDGFAHDRNDRIKVVHYDGTHKVLNTVFYDSPNGKYKYLRYIGSVVDGSKRVFVATYGYNGKASEDKNPAVIVSKINAGETKFSHSVTKVSNDFNDTKSVMLYNHGNNKLQLMTVTYNKSNMGADLMFASAPFDYYKKKEVSCITVLSYIDPESLSLISANPIIGMKVDAYGKQNIDKDYEFDGVPQNMVLNKDNTTTILMEDLTNITERHGGGMGHVGHTTVKTDLGPVGISELSEAGVETGGFAISKLQKAEGTLPILYMSGRSKGVFAYPQSIGKSSNNNEFLSYDYIYSDKGRYVIFNDLPRNADKDEEDEKRKTVSKVSKTNTMCYKLNNPKIDKFFLFGEPTDNSESTFCYIQSSDFNKELNCYATMIVERDGRSKVAKIAWITFE